ncbi:hypothetical protein OIHEL45_09918 [Sulfitobacter indolifex HEL-45]|uniref:Uncharacterized protein n=1 Tax=Sulfitobacter indolifex HEL-45 TaxID=391624 RepID=A0ABP2D9V9_9RHOB|nr:hypothetical protein OIHEL45_09918 [Sulfitobacter indolifex HEL-45]
MNLQKRFTIWTLERRRAFARFTVPNRFFENPSNHLRVAQVSL